MKSIITTLEKYVAGHVRTCFSLLICLVLITNTASGIDAPIGSKPHKGSADSASSNMPATYWGPLRIKLASPSTIVTNDPIRFSVQFDKQTIHLGETVELTITAELLNISPNLLFFQPGSNAYTLKMLMPEGFEQTGGSFTEYVADELSYPSRNLKVYHIRGYFRTVTPGSTFRLLRGQGQTVDQGLFVEKATIMLQALSTEAIDIRQATRGGASTTLYVITTNSHVTSTATASNGAARVAAASYRGFLDYAICDAVSGWVLDMNNTQQSQQVDIYINGVKAATVLADQRRQDVANAFNIQNFNAYGYTWLIPAYYKSNTALTVSVRPANTAVDLTQSPARTGVCPGTSAAPVTTTPPATTTTTSPTTTTVTPPVTTTTTSPSTTGGALTMLPPTYNCATGAITFRTSGGDGTPIRFRASGITDWSTNPNQYLDAGSRVNADTPPFTIYFEQSGKVFTYNWSRQATCNGTPTTPPASTTTAPTTTTVTPPVTTTVTPPATTTVTPPVTVTVAPPVTPPTTGGALTMLPPTYNCATGAITFNTSGGDGTPIKFMSPGITDWTTNPNQYLDAGSRVNADTPPFTFYFQQSGKIATYNWSRQATCNGTPTTPPASTTTAPTTTTVTPPVTTTVTPPATTTVTPPVTVTVAPPVTPPTTGGALTMLPPTYNCATGAITFNTSGGDGTPIKFMSPGITDWTTNPNQYLDAGSRVNADTPPFTFYFQQSGKIATYNWSRQATCNGTTTTPPVTTTVTPPATTTVTPPTTTTVTPPVTVTVAPPVTPPTTGGALTMLPPTYNCATGAITFNTSGGDGTPIKFMSPGITDWTTNPNQYLDAGSRVNADTPPFTFYFQQSGKIATYNWSRQATCNGTTTPSPSTPAPSTPVTPPVSATTTPPPTNSTSGFYGYRGDTFSYEPLPAADPNSDPMPAFETDKIKVTLALRNQSSKSTTPGMGGAIYQIYNKQRPNQTLVFNANVWAGEDQGIPRTGSPNQIFTGQGLSECLYQRPRPYFGISETNEQPENPWLGYNPNEVGDDHGNSGRLLKYGKVGNTKFYTETTPMIYGQVQSPATEVLMKKWGEVKDRALILNYESTFNRSAMERSVTQGQEAPCLYVNNLRVFKYYNGNNPYSGDGITTFVAPTSASGNGSSATSTNGQRPGGLFVTEPWVGVFGEDGYGIALMLKDNMRSYIGYWGDGGGDMAMPNKGGSYGYIAHAMNEILDMNIRWRHRTEVIVGTVEEIRAYVYANSYRPASRPSFKFNTAGREGWSLNSGDGDDMHTWDEKYTGQARNGWKVYFGPSGNASIKSPGAAWNTSQFNKIYIRMAYTGAETQWSLHFRRNRQKGEGNLDFTGKYGNEEAARYPDGTADRPEQTKKFAVKGDGQFRVYEIDLSQNPEWRNIINEISLQPHAVDGKYVYQSGEYAIIDWIDTNPNGPSN